MVPINDAPASTTTNPLVFPSDQNPIPTIINPTSPYHPYSYETVYVTKNSNLSEDSGLNAFDTPNDIQYDDNGNLHAKDGLVPSENIDNKLVTITLLLFPKLLNEYKSHLKSFVDFLFHLLVYSGIRHFKYWQRLSQSV